MLKLILLFVCIILTAAIWLIGSSNSNEHKTDNTNNTFESYHTEDIESNTTEENITLTDEEIMQPDIPNETQDGAQNQQDLVPENHPSKDEEEANAQPNINWQESIYEDMKDLYYGRLYIPELNINVALYYGHYQYITDRIDSANIFYLRNSNYLIIADHNDQEFAKLLNVKVGMTGYIQKYVGRINIECVDVFPGLNTGKLTYQNGQEILDNSDYLMYTCWSDSKNIIICLWDEVKYEINSD